MQATAVSNVSDTDPFADGILTTGVGWVVGTVCIHECSIDNSTLNAQQP